MANSAPHSDTNPDSKRSKKEIQKLELEIKQLSSDRMRFYIGSVFVPIFVAICTLIIFYSSGFFDTHEKLIEIAKHDFKEDTAAFAKTKVTILNQINLLREDSSILRDTISTLKNKVHIYDSILNSIHKNAKGQEKALFNLADSVSYLHTTILALQALRQKTSDSVRSMMQTIMEFMNRVAILQGQYEKVYDLQRINAYFQNENKRLQRTIDSLQSLQKQH